MSQDHFLESSCEILMISRKENFEWRKLLKDLKENSQNHPLSYKIHAASGFSLYKGLKQRIFFNENLSLKEL